MARAFVHLRMARGVHGAGRMVSTMFFDHPIAALVVKLASREVVRPDVAVVLASVAELRRELGVLGSALEGELCDVVVPILRAYFAAVVLASQVERGREGSERMEAFAEYARGAMDALGPRVGPGAREIAGRVLAPRAKGRA